MDQEPECERIKREKIADIENVYCDICGKCEPVGIYNLHRGRLPDSRKYCYRLCVHILEDMYTKVNQKSLDVEDVCHQCCVNAMIQYIQMTYAERRETLNDIY